MKMILKKVPINREKLRLIPESELQLYVGIQIVISEINCLRRFLILQSSSFEDKVVEMAQNSQRLFLLRMLAGKSYESWEFLRMKFLTSKLSNIYEPLLESEEKDSLKKIKRYFGKANALKLVRNRYAFHYSEGIKNLMDKLNGFPDSDPMEIYIAEAEGNCYYSMAQLLLNVSFVESFPGSDQKEKIENLFTEILSAAEWFIKLFQGLIIAITKRHLDFDGEEILIQNPPSLHGIKIPYFLPG